jgi:hypothetical protein
MRVNVNRFILMAKAKPKPKAEIKASFSVRFDQAERQALAAAAKAEDRPEAYLVRQFVREALKAKGFLKC